MKTITVEVCRDHLESLSRVRQPVYAIAELIWNGLDANASDIKVNLTKNTMRGIDSITIIDNGDGIDYADAEIYFAYLGGSWKRGTRLTRGKKRFMHGRAGKGRFRAFALGDDVTWTTRYQADHSVQEYTIRGNRREIGKFYLSDSYPSKKKTGTEVVIVNLVKGFPSLGAPTAVQKVTEYFAPYIKQYPGVRITYDGVPIDAANAIKAVENYPLSVVLEDGRAISAVLQVVEWKGEFSDRALYLCDEDGFPLEEAAVGIHAYGFVFTAYLKSRFLRELHEDGLLSLKELHPPLDKVLGVAKKALKKHFRERSASNVVGLVDEWKKEGSYPYTGEPAGMVEKVEREVFDVCAYNLHEYLPSFAESDPQNKKVTFAFLKHVLETDSSSLGRIIFKLLDLPMEKQDAFADLLEKTTLSAVITASKTVVDRLDFLLGLDQLLFNKESKRTLLERKQLQKILEERTWIFGEEYNISVSDQSLEEVLKEHLHLLGREEEVTEPVLRDDGSGGVVDFMLSRVVPQSNPEQREHLIIEIKRPIVKIDMKVLGQVQSYAMAVTTDERFKNTNTRWTFMALSNDMTPDAQAFVRQRDRAPGIAFVNNDVIVWAKTWGEIIEPCRARMEFFRKHLEYSATTDSALKYLQATIKEKLLPECFRLTENAPTQSPGEARPEGG